MSDNKEFHSEASSEKEQSFNTNGSDHQDTSESNAQEVSIEENAHDLSSELAAEKERYLRLFAEFENFKKRTQKEKMEFYQYASQDVVTSMLSILDDFERAMREMEKSGESENLQGIQLIYNKFKNTLVDKGLTSIEVSPGDDFNVDYHEAVTQIPAPSPELKGKVVDVLEPGYRLHDRVIRFSKVVIGA